MQEIGNTLGPALKGLGAHGWRISGKSPKLRVEIVVPRTVVRPDRSVPAFDIGEYKVKPAVVSSHAAMRRSACDGDGPTAIGLAHALAPGARIRAGRGSFQNFIGVAAVLVVDGALKLLTCGHAPAFQFSDEILAGDEPDGVAIATVVRNLLDESPPIDAALCTLTDAGMQLMAQSPAPTWRFQTIKKPDPTDNGAEAVFWQTHDGDDSAPTSPVVSYCGSNSALFPVGGPQDSLIETLIDVTGGDSGSLLSLRDSLYGLCSGYVGNTSFYTSIDLVATRITEGGQSCTVASFPGS